VKFCGNQRGRESLLELRLLLLFTGCGTLPFLLFIYLSKPFSGNAFMEPIDGFDAPWIMRPLAKSV